MVGNVIKKANSALSRITVVLVNPQNSGNVGAIARSMANFGLEKLVIVGDFVVDDEARNRAKHANYLLDNVIKVKSFDKARALFDVVIGTSGVVGTDFNVVRSPLLVEEATDSLKDFRGNIGLFFGPEDSGLSNEELLRCDFVVNIPCSDDYGVMNLSHAATIIFYEFFKVFSKNNIRSRHVLASVKERDIAYDVIRDVVEDMSFRAESDKRTQLVVWKRVLGKSFVTKREIFSLIGFFRNVVFALEERKKSSEKNKRQKQIKVQTKKELIGKKVKKNSQTK